MKKIYLLWVALLITFAFVYAGILDSINGEVELTSRQVTALEMYGIESPEIRDFTCGEHDCGFYMYQQIDENTTYPLGYHRLPKYECFNYTKNVCVNKTDYTDLELRAMLNDKIQDHLSDYADTLIIRIARERQQRFDNGNVVITETR